MNADAHAVNGNAFDLSSCFDAGHPRITPTMGQTSNPFAAEKVASSAMAIARAAFHQIRKCELAAQIASTMNITESTLASPMLQSQFSHCAGVNRRRFARKNGTSTRMLNKSGSVLSLSRGVVWVAKYKTATDVAHTASHIAIITAIVFPPVIRPSNR